MENLRRLGRYLFAVAIVGTGVQHLIYAHLRAGLGPPWTPQTPFWAYLDGLILLISGICLLIGKRVDVAAALIAAVCFVAAMVLHVPGLVANIHKPGPWTSGSELVALCGVALVVLGTAANSLNPSKVATAVGRTLFAISLPVFGVQHFLYARFVSTLVPGWIPGRYFWAVFVGCAFVAAALAILTHKLGGLASGLLGAMFLTWVVILHAPRIAASPHVGNEWISGFVALAMAGGSFLVSASLSADASASSLGVTFAPPELEQRRSA